MNLEISISTWASPRPGCRVARCPDIPKKIDSKVGKRAGQRGRSRDKLGEAAGAQPLFAGSCRSRTPLSHQQHSPITIIIIILSALPVRRYIHCSGIAHHHFHLTGERQKLATPPSPPPCTGNELILRTTLGTIAIDRDSRFTTWLAW